MAFVAHQMMRRLVEQTEAHVIIGLLSLLSGGSGSGLSSSRGGGGSSGSSSGVGIGVGNAVLELLNLGPRVVGLDSDGKNLLVAVDEGVHDGGKGGVVGSQRDGGDGLDSRGEGVEQLLAGDVKDIGAEALAGIVHLLNGHTVGEGRDVQQVKQRGLGGTDLAAGLNKLEVGNNFDSTTSNLGGDTKGLEERGLTRLHTSVTGGNPDVTGSEGTSTGGGGDTVSKDLLLDGAQVSVGEDETNVTCEGGVMLAQLIP